MSFIFAHAAPSRPPKNLRGYATGSRSAQLYWAAPDQQYRNGIITEYHVDITEAATNRVFGSYIVTTTQIGVTSLHPYYEYNFTVAAYTTGKGPASNGLVIRTYQDGKPISNGGINSRGLIFLQFLWYIINHQQKKIPIHKNLNPT